MSLPPPIHATAQVVYPIRPLQDGEELPLGQLRLRVMHTPGHRRELISLLVVNPPRSPEASMVLTGDSLLVGIDDQIAHLLKMVALLLFAPSTHKAIAEKGCLIAWAQTAKEVSHWYI